jgi:hypothetical protein
MSPRYPHIRSWPRLFLIAALIPGHLFDWGIEWAFAAATTALGMATYPRLLRRRPTAARIGLGVLIVLTLVSMVGYIFTLALASFPTGVRDAVELIKPAMVYFSCAYALVVGASTTVEQLRRACFIVLVYGLVCGVALMLEAPVLGGVVEAIYGTTKTAFSDYYMRLSIPFENPNFLGLFAVLSLTLALNFAPRPDLRLVVVSLAATGLSGSRTAWLTSALVLSFFVLGVARRLAAAPRRLSWPHLLLGVALPATLLAAVPLAAESYQRAADFLDLVIEFDLGSDESYSERIALRAAASALILDRPGFGWGAMKYTSLDIVDSQYFSLLLRFGVPATLLLALVAIFGAAAHVRMAAPGPDRRAAALMWFILAVWLWNGTFLENIRLAVLITIFFSAVVVRRASAVH